MYYDYIIVGAGSAGCVLANRLSADPTVRVLLLEAGGVDKQQTIHIPAAWGQNLKSAIDWNYHTVPQAHLDNRAMYWPRGKTLGGSSAINAMIYMRGSRYDYDHWAELGNEGWSYDEVLPYFKRAEDNERGADEYHGTDGPLHVADQHMPNPLTKAFVKAGQAVGIPYRADFNGESQEGIGLFQTTTRNGKRQSSAVAYLKPILSRPNLTVLTGAHTTRILFEGKRAVGVAYVEAGMPREAHTGGEVILCGGAVNSPQLLMLSGIGPADHLRELNIEVVSDLPGVGQNLQDHLVTGIGFHTPHPISLLNAKSPLELAKYLVMGRGMLRSNGGEAGGFIQLDPQAPAPDIQFHFFPAFLYNHGLTPMEGHGFSMGVTVVRPRARGYIALHSDDPLQHPHIQPNYLADEAEYDLNLYVQAIKRAREIAYSYPFDRYRGGEFIPGYEVQTDEQLRDYVRWQIQTLYHPVGSCKMGGDSLAVVNDLLQVHTVQNLRVVDGSIMPTITSGNTNAPIIMIGEKAADLILNKS